MHTVWAQRREEVWNDCSVSPDVFTQMVHRLGEFVVPYQHALETEVSERHVHLYLQGLLSDLERKNAEKIATFVDVERQVIQDFIGTVPWDHRFRSQQFPQTRHAFGGRQAPMVRPPGQGR